MMPVVPASVSASPRLSPSQLMSDHRDRPADGQAGDCDDPEQPVVDQHVQAHEDQPDDAGDHARTQGSLAERRRHGAHVVLLELHRQRTEAQRDRQVACTRLVERARDDRRALELGGADDRGRLDHAVEHDRHLLPEVTGCYLVETDGALVGEIDVDDPLVVERCCCLGDGFAGELGRAQHVSHRLASARQQHCPIGEIVLGSGELGEQLEPDVGGIDLLRLGIVGSLASL